MGNRVARSGSFWSSAYEAEANKKFYPSAVYPCEKITGVL
jgi:hypothetical protein